MTERNTDDNERAQLLRRALRAARGRYDRLERGKTAAIRRSRSAGDVALEGSYWRVGDTLARDQPHLPHVVLLFPFAAHVTKDTFSFGRYLRRQIGESEGAQHRFRRLLDSRERDDLDHRLRGILRLAASDGSRVDWGVLGTDILWFFAASGAVRRRWAQDFYAPSLGNASPSDSTPSRSAASNS